MRVIKLLKAVIYFVFIAIGGVFIKISINGEIWPFNGKSLSNYDIIRYMVSTSVVIVICIILYQLLKVVKNLEVKDFFNFSNVKRFKYISYCIWYFVIVQLVGSTIDGEFEFGDLEMVLTSVALFVQVLSVIFNEAYKLKESEEQLKEENKLVI